MGALKNIELSKSNSNLDSSQYLNPKKCFSSNSSRSSSVSNFSSVSTHQDTRLRGPIVSVKKNTQEEKTCEEEVKSFNVVKKESSERSPTENNKINGKGKIANEVRRKKVSSDESDNVKIDDIKSKVNNSNKSLQTSKTKSPSLKRNLSPKKSEKREGSPTKIKGKANLEAKSDGKAEGKAEGKPAARVPGPVPKRIGKPVGAGEARSPSPPPPCSMTDQEKFEVLFQRYSAWGIEVSGDRAEGLSAVQLTKWLRNVKIVDGKKVSDRRDQLYGRWN